MENLLFVYFKLCNISFLLFFVYHFAGRNDATGAIAGGVAAGAALLFAAPAMAFAWWKRRKPHEHFFDVPGYSRNSNLILN